MGVSISKGNSKMGDIKSVSLPSIITCGDFPCKDKCYAHRIERRRPSVAQAYRNNLEILTTDPDKYWREVEAAIMTSRFFRFHVSGDIPNQRYFIKMIQVSLRNPHCDILCFTKKYDIVNGALDIGFVIPKNLHVIFSGWRGITINNPHNLPEAHVVYKDATTTARPDAIMCGGNCTRCAIENGGCWTLKSGEQIVFNEH